MEEDREETRKWQQRTSRFELRFSEDVALSFRTLRDRAFVVAEGDVTAAPRAARQHPVADYRKAAWQRGSDRGTAQDDRSLRYPGSHLHQRRQKTVQPQ